MPINSPVDYLLEVYVILERRLCNISIIIRPDRRKYIDNYMIPLGVIVGFFFSNKLYLNLQAAKEK